MSDKVTSENTDVLISKQPINDLSGKIFCAQISPLAHTIEAARDVGGCVLISAKRHPNTYLSKTVTRLSTAEEYFAKFPSELGWNLYFGPAIRKPGTKSRGKESILAFSSLWVDVDFSDISEVDARKWLAEFPLRPSVIIHSGGGLHLYWFLREPEIVVDPALWRAILRGLALTLGGDTSSADIAHILRPAHSPSMNYPNAKKIAQGRSPAPVVCEHFNDVRYNPVDFEEFAEKTSTTISPSTIIHQFPRRGNLPARLWRDVRRDKKLSRIWNGHWSDPNHQYRSGHDSALTTALVARGYSDPDVASALMNFNHGKAADRGKKYLTDTIQNVRRFVSENQTPEAKAAREFIDSVQAAADSMKWGGRERVVWFGRDREPRSARVSLSGSRTVLAAILRKAYALGKTRFQLSHRNIAEESGKGRAVVKKSLILLVERGLIRIKRGATCTEISVTLPPKEAQSRTKVSLDSKIFPPVNLWYENEPLIESSPGLDVFRHGALNTSGWLVLDALARLGPLIPKRIKAATGLSRATVTRALKRLREAEAVTKDGRKYAPQVFDYEAVAERYGTAGRQARQIARHERERESWQEKKQEHLRLKHPRNQKRKPAPALASNS